jgi:hypothetical protein
VLVHHRIFTKNNYIGCFNFKKLESIFTSLKIENYMYKFQKILEKKCDHVSSKCTKSQCIILCVSSYTKMIKYDA